MDIDVPIRCKNCGRKLTGFTISKKPIVFCWYCALKGSNNGNIK